MHKSASLSDGSAPGRRVALAAATLALLCASTAMAGDVAVVVHSSVKVDELSFNDLRKVLLGDRQFWSKGQLVTLVVRAPVAAERTVMLDKIYEMSEAQFKQYWVAKVFRAEANEGPKVVISNDKAVELVGVIVGAVALVDASDVPEGIKVLKIDGKLPGEDGYPLKE